MSNLVFSKGLKAALLVTAFMSASNACADIVISGTRIVYPQSTKDVVVNLDNHGNKPLLVQTWLDDGRADVNPQELKLPLLLPCWYHALIRKRPVRTYYLHRHAITAGS